MAIFGRSFPLPRTRVHKQLPAKLQLSGQATIVTSSRSTGQGTTSIAGKSKVTSAANFLGTVLLVAKATITTSSAVKFAGSVRMAIQTNIFPAMRGGATFARYFAGVTEIAARSRGNSASLIGGLFGKSSITTTASVSGIYRLAMASKTGTQAKVSASGTFRIPLNGLATTLLVKAKGKLLGSAFLGAVTKIVTAVNMALPGAALLMANAFTKLTGRGTVAGTTPLSGEASVQSDALLQSDARTSLSGSTAVKSQVRLFVISVIANVVMTARAAIAAMGGGGVGAQTSLSASAKIQGNTNLSLPVSRMLLNALAQVGSSMQASIFGRMAMAATAFTAAQASSFVSNSGSLAFGALAFVRSFANATYLRFTSISPTTVSAPSLLYPRVIEIRRVRHSATPTDSIGKIRYSGDSASTYQGDQQSEQILIGGVPASIQAKQAGRKKDGTLPADPAFAPTWDIFIPRLSLAKGVVRDRDIIVDDDGYRYQVAQNYWNLLGYRLVCIRLEA